MNATIRSIRNTHRAALAASKHLAYRTLSGIIALYVDQGRLVKTGDFLDRVGGSDLRDGYQSWYGQHAKKAYIAANGASPIRVWAQHRTTGRWIHVAAYAPTDPALMAGLRSYKQTRHLADQAQFAEAA